MANMFEETLSHAQFLARHTNGDLQSMTVMVLFELGIPTKRIGFEYLTKAVVVCHNEPTQTITKGIYPNVGRNYDPIVGKHQVEQTIRSAISAAWEDRDENVWRLYFAPDRNGNLKKPSNFEFISRIARFLDLCLGCCKEVGYER